MSLTAIPIEFEKYLQNKISTGQAPDMNEMIFAYLPDLDLSQEIDRTTGLPDITYWVHQQDIDQVGKLGDNALVYSVVIPGSVAEFTFNAIYLRDKNTVNSCGMVVHKADETKEAGMASTKSLVQQYTGAAQIAGITVDAATWQIDYQARLSGIENDIRLAWLDYYGHTAFINGYNVIQQADKTKFKITAGTAYVGGLRAVLENDVIQTLSTLPTALYLDVVREGTVLSVWSNLVSVVASETALSDYVDERDQQHYVAKIADIAADGSVTIDRPLSEMEAHLQAEDPHPQYVRGDELAALIVGQNQKYKSDRVYYCGDVCFTEDENGKKTFWEWYSNKESLAGKSPTSSSNRQDGWTDETKPFYWTPYKKARPGTPLWPWMSMTFPEGTLNVLGNSVPSAVFWRLAESLPEFVDSDAGMIDFPETRGEFFRVLDQARGIDTDRVFGSSQEDELKSHTHTYRTNGSTAVGTSDGTVMEYPTETQTGATGGDETRPRNLSFPVLVEI